jgi:hypothetical protein
MISIFQTLRNLRQNALKIFPRLRELVFRVPEPRRSSRNKGNP